MDEHLTNLVTGISVVYDHGAIGEATNESVKRFADQKKQRAELYTAACNSTAAGTKELSNEN